MRMATAGRHQCPAKVPKSRLATLHSSRKLLLIHHYVNTHKPARWQWKQKARRTQDSQTDIKELKNAGLNQKSNGE